MRSMNYLFVMPLNQHKLFLIKSGTHSSGFVGVPILGKNKFLFYILEF